MKSCNLILTGWGYSEYVAASAAALKALKGDAEIKGVSKRRLPELLEEISVQKRNGTLSAVYILGVSLSGDPERLASALAKLQGKSVAVTWISAVEMPDGIAEKVTSLLDAKVFDTSLLETVGQAFSVDVELFKPLLKESGKVSGDMRDYLKFIAAAQFYYRNYQDQNP